MAAAKKELTKDDPEFLPVQYNLQKAKITKLKKEYDPALIPDSKEKGDEGYLIIHEKAMAIVKVRSRIEAKRKELKADALAWGKLVDGEAKRLTEIIAALEKPWKELKNELDEKEAKEAEAARQKELERIQVIEAKVEQLKGATNGLLGVSVVGLKERLALISEVVIDELYGDYVEAAQHHKGAAITAIESAINEREVFETQQAELKANQDALEVAQKEIDDKAKAAQKELDDKAADLEKTRLANEAEAQRLKDIAEKQQQADDERAQAEKDREKAEALLETEKQEREEKEVELKARMPEDTKIRAYLGDLRSVPLPDIKDHDLQRVVSRVLIKLDEISDIVFTGTQTDINFTEQDNREE